MANMKKLFYTALIGLVLVFLANCSKSNDLNSSESTFSTIYTNTLNPSCIQCHKPGTPAYVTSGVRLDFTTQATAFSTLTTQNASGTTSGANCTSALIPYVQSASPTTSFLMAVLFSDHWSPSFVATGCAPYSVHHTDVSLSAAEKTAIVNWINAGAPNN